MKKILASIMAVTALFASCSNHKGVDLRDESDSVAYVVGMNIAANLMAMDSTINVEAVCSGIRDAVAGATVMSMDEARLVYLRYVNYSKAEKIRDYENQFLDDIQKNNRSYARTKSGLTYNVEVIGDERNTPSSDSDTVVMRYVGKRSDGSEFYSSYQQDDTTTVAFGTLQKGLQEGIKLIGKGGKIIVWIPSDLAYGVEGNEEFNIKSNTTLYYEIELLDVRKRSTANTQNNF